MEQVQLGHPSFQLGEATATNAAANPDVKFTIVDFGFDPDIPNVRELVYQTDEAAFAAGYLATADDAEDVVQEVFARVLAADTVPEDFRAWVYRLTRNRCLNWRRDAGRRKDAAPMATGFDAALAASGPLTRLVKDERRERLVEELARLPAELREVLMLRYVDGLGRGEIAAVLDVPVSTVKSRLFQGVQRLRDGWEP